MGVRLQNALTLQNDTLSSLSEHLPDLHRWKVVTPVYLRVIAGAYNVPLEERF